MLELILVCQFVLNIVMYYMIKVKLHRLELLVRVTQEDVDYLSTKPIREALDDWEEHQDKMNIINTSSLNRLDIQSPIPRKACNSVERNNSDELQIPLASASCY